MIQPYAGLRRGKNSAQKEICPKCRKPGFPTKHWAKKKDYVYYYFAHGHGKRRRNCYLGKLKRDNRNKPSQLEPYQEYLDKKQLTTIQTKIMTFRGEK